ncbi:MAG: right-handed parallel beta-helix repeat-containing protein [Dehalococcoidia bacterium]|nr:right-handed parallel beta-helix repeat-containing protein [Dehalococcoidia bacterium]
MRRLFVSVALVAAAATLGFVAQGGLMVGQAVTSPPLVIDAPGVYDGGGATIDVGCGAEHNVVINADGVTLRNYTLLNANESAITIGGRTGTVIENVTIKGFNCADGQGQYLAGVACWGCTALTVQDSHIETSRTFGDGVWVKNYGSGSGGGHVFVRNTIVGGFDGIGGEPEDQPYGGVFRDALIRENVIRDCADDGIQVEGGNVNVRVLDNTVDGCALGVALAPNVTGPLYVEHNLIRNLKVGYYGAQACFKIGDGGAGATFLTGNTCATDGDGFKQTNPGLSPIVARGNCIQVSRYVIETSGAFPPTASFDFDRLWTSDPDRFIKWDGVRYADLASFNAATGQELNGAASPSCATSGAAPTPAPPEATPTPAPSTCEVLVRVDGVLQWITKDISFCR